MFRRKIEVNLRFEKQEGESLMSNLIELKVIKNIIECKFYESALNFKEYTV